MGVPHVRVIKKIIGYFLLAHASRSAFLHFCSPLKKKKNCHKNWFLGFSVFQTVFPDCPGYGGLPVMASPRQPPAVWPGRHTPAGLAVGVSVPHAGGRAQRSGETPRNKVWKQPQDRANMHISSRGNNSNSKLVIFKQPMGAQHTDAMRSNLLTLVLFRVRVRYQKRQKLQFETKLGMNSPFWCLVWVGPENRANWARPLPTRQMRFNQQGALSAKYNNGGGVFIWQSFQLLGLLFLK